MAGLSERIVDSVRNRKKGLAERSVGENGRFVEDSRVILMHERIPTCHSAFHREDERVEVHQQRDDVDVRERDLRV